MTTKQKSTQTVKHLSAIPLASAKWRCQYVLSNGSQCSQSVVGTSSFCEQHGNWLPADLEVFKAVGEHYRQDLRDFWTRSNFYLLAEAGLLSIFISTSGHTSKYGTVIDLAFIVLGGLLAVIWFFVAKNSLFWIQQWRTQMIEVDEKIDRLQCFSRLERLVIETPFKNPYLLTQFLPLLFGITWLGLLAVLIFYS